MHERLNQKQEGGDESTNIQARNVTITGVSFADARQIAIDAMKSEMGALSHAAEQAALLRINEYAEALLERLERRPELLERFQEPRTQFSVRDTHRLHAKRGADDVVDLTLDMLVDFIACRGSDFKSVVLDDAIKVTHSLTCNQIDALTLLLIFRKLPLQADTIEGWCDEMAELAKPFMEGATHSEAQLDYLASTGCTTMDVINQTFASYFSMRFRHLASEVDLNPEIPAKAKTGNDFIDRQATKNLKKRVSTDWLRDYFSNARPEIVSLQSYFDTTVFRRSNLRIIGSAIAAANLRLKQPRVQFGDSLWFEE